VNFPPELQNKIEIAGLYLAFGLMTPINKEARDVLHRDRSHHQMTRQHSQQGAVAIYGEI
jgi:hypothetical protein